MVLATLFPNFFRGIIHEYRRYLVFAGIGCIGYGTEELRPHNLPMTILGAGRATRKFIAVRNTRWILYLRLNLR